MRGWENGGVEGGMGKGSGTYNSEEALLSQARLLATHMEHAAEYAVAIDFKVGSNRVHPGMGMGKWWS